MLLIYSLSIVTPTKEHKRCRMNAHSPPHASRPLDLTNGVPLNESRKPCWSHPTRCEGPSSMQDRPSDDCMFGEAAAWCSRMLQACWGSKLYLTLFFPLKSISRFIITCHDILIIITGCSAHSLCMPLSTIYCEILLCCGLWITASTRRAFPIIGMN